MLDCWQHAAQLGVFLILGLSILEGKEDIFSELIEKGPKTYLVS